jgi:hypothetical protein
MNLKNKLLTRSSWLRRSSIGCGPGMIESSIQIFTIKCL